MKKQLKLISVILSIFITLNFCGCAKSENSNNLSGSNFNGYNSVISEQENSSKNSNSAFLNAKAENTPEKTAKEEKGFSLKSVPAFSGNSYVKINNNIPYFTSKDYTVKSYEYYSDLDSLGRCGVCVAVIGKDLMPTEERGAIGSVKPTGWHTVKYDNIDGKYLYNRCHLIGYQLSGENANVKNLITGTRYLNVKGMLPFENMVADYVKETGNHVLYRATPIFEGTNYLAKGVLLEGYSIEDGGKGICFNVFCYNSQPGININYATGESSLNARGNTNAGAQSKTQSKNNTNAKSSSSKKVTVKVPDKSQTVSNGVWVPKHGVKKYHSKKTCSGMKDPLQVSAETAKATDTLLVKNVIKFFY